MIESADTYEAEGLSSVAYPTRSEALALHIERVDVLGSEISQYYPELCLPASACLALEGGRLM